MTYHFTVSRAITQGFSALLLIACFCLPMLSEAASGSSAQQRHALAMWQERCKRSGEFIHKTADNVAGVFLLNLRSTSNFGDQFRLDDPYGSDSIGDEYLLNFLRGYYYRSPNFRPEGFPPRTGYRFVEARDPKDGMLYRYTGRIEEPWQTDKSYLKGYTRLLLDKVPITTPSTRYGVRFEDISTHEDRKLWIAGGSLKVIDLSTQEVLAERIGYMIDLGQGSLAGQRSPWLLAANNACPDFHRNYPSNVPRRGSTAQGGQTLDFIEKVLTPIL